MNFYGIFCGTWKFHIMKIFTNHMVKIVKASHRFRQIEKTFVAKRRFFVWAVLLAGERLPENFAPFYSELTKIRTRRRAADSTDSTTRQGNAVLVFVNSL